MDDEYARVQSLMSNNNAVFVFGSNLAGRHGAGAARVARKRYGAITGQAEGHMGRCYAIPTKDASFQPLSLAQIRRNVLRFLGRASIATINRPETIYVVTRVGCGLAGYTDELIAPMFVSAPSNCFLPKGWLNWDEWHRVHGKVNPG